MDKTYRTYKWFVKHYDEVYKQINKDGFVAISIKSKEIIQFSKSFGDCVHKANEKNKLGTFIVQEVKKNKEEALTAYATTAF